LLGAGLQRPIGSAEGFTRVFFAAAAAISISLLLLLALKEKPLHTDVARQAG